MAIKQSLLARADDSVLVLIDIQQRLLDAMPEGVGEKMIKQVDILVQAANVLQIPVMVTEQYPKGLGNTVPKLMERLPIPALEKTCFSCVQLDEFISYVRSNYRGQIILTGMESHICVLQTALELHEQQFQVFVVEDAICSRQTQNQQNALLRLRQAGVIVSNTESVLFEWLGDAKHKEFRTLSKLVV